MLFGCFLKLLSCASEQRRRGESGVPPLSSVGERGKEGVWGCFCIITIIYIHEFSALVFRVRVKASVRVRIGNVTAASQDWGLRFAAPKP